MRRAGLVARREYVANLRTVTFWLGILSFPVMLLVSGAGAYWFMGYKDARAYAVVDNSGWLADAVDERSAYPDLERVLELAVESYAASGESFAALPPVLQGIAPTIAPLTPTQRSQLARVLAASAEPEGLGSQFPESARLGLEQFNAQVRSWWRGLPQEQAAKLDRQLARGRYTWTKAEGLGASWRQDLNAKLLSGDLFAYFVIADDPLTASVPCEYVSTNLTDVGLRDWFVKLASEEVRVRRMTALGIDSVVIDRVSQPLVVVSKKISKEGELAEVSTRDLVRQWAPMLFMYLLWVAVFLSAQMLLSDLVEEKSNRIIEVLLSSISPLELMLGKVVGIGATGLTVIGAWVACGVIAVAFTPQAYLPLERMDLWAFFDEPAYLLGFGVYFLLGYLLFASFMAGLGSLCNDIREAQNLLQPVMILLIVPFLAMVPVSQDPNGPLAVILSYIPLYTPFIMMMRAAGPPTTFEYASTTALLVVSVGVALWLSARVFRVGILMTGKPPRLRDIYRMLVSSGD